MYADLFKSLHNDIAIQKRNAEGDMFIFYFNQGEYVKKLLFKIRRGLADLEKKLGYELNSLAFLRELCNICKESIIWLENDRNLTFCICKKDIRKDISRLLFKKDVCTVLTSATISSSSVGEPAERCRYFLETLDFPTDKGIVSEPKKSPFDYDKNTMLYVSPNMPYPGHSKEERRQYADAAISEITKLLAVTNGKALILFTAKSDMTYVYGRLTNEKLPYKLFIQNDSSSQKRRLEKFRADTNSVILGSGTFWEGISRLRTKGFLDEKKYNEQLSVLENKKARLERELNRLSKADDEDETLEQLDTLIDCFEGRTAMITEFDDELFGMIMERIVVRDNILEFHLISGLKFNEEI